MVSIQIQYYNYILHLNRYLQFYLYFHVGHDASVYQLSNHYLLLFFCFIMDKRLLCCLRCLFNVWLILEEILSVYGLLDPDIVNFSL